MIMTVQARDKLMSLRDVSEMLGWVGLDGEARFKMGHIGKLRERRYQARWVDPKLLGVLQKLHPSHGRRGQDHRA
jgi:hypothetical protein